MIVVRAEIPLIAYIGCIKEGGGRSNMTVGMFHVKRMPAALMGIGIKRRNWCFAMLSKAIDKAAHMERSSA